MAVLTWGMVGLGLGMTILGFVLPDRVRAPLDGLVVWLAPAGLALTLIAVLRLCVPGFFDAPSVVPGDPNSSPPADPVSAP